LGSSESPCTFLDTYISRRPCAFAHLRQLEAGNSFCMQIAAENADHGEDSDSDEVDEVAQEEMEWRDIWGAAEEEFLTVYPHEIAIMCLRQLEIGSCVGSALISWNAYLLFTMPTASTYTDLLLCGLCFLRVTIFFPRLWSWVQMHRLFREARNQPTPQLLRQKLALAKAWRCPGAWVLNGAYYSWLGLVPCVIWFGSATEFSGRLWNHWRVCFLWLVSSCILHTVLFFWLKSSAMVQRGISNAYLEAATTVILFKHPWSGFGDPECGICLVEYEKNQAIRMLPCSHHFHSGCVDTWLQQYLNRCPFCQVTIEAARIKED